MSLIRHSRHLSMQHHNQVHTGNRISGLWHIESKLFLYTNNNHNLLT